MVALTDDADYGAIARSELLSDPHLAAPDLLDVEVLSALRRRVLAGDMSARRLRVALTDLLDLPIERLPTVPFLIAASKALHHLTAYDAMYAVIAAEFDADLVTFDERLARAPRLPCRVRVPPTP